MIPLKIQRLEVGNQLTEKIGLKIRALRKAQGLTQEQLAEKAEISYKYLGELERGQINPGIMNLFKIASTLDIPLRYMVDVQKDEITEENSLREEILGLLAGKIYQDLKRVVKILRAVFS